MYSVARLCPYQSFLSLCHRRRVAGLSMLYKINSNSNHCLFSQLPSASTRVRHTRAAVAARPLEFEVSRCRTCQIARYFLPAHFRMWNYLLYTVFDTLTLVGFKSAVPLVASLNCVFFLRGAGVCITLDFHNNNNNRYR